MLTHVLGVSEEKGWIIHTHCNTHEYDRVDASSSLLFSPLLPSFPLFSPPFPSSPLTPPPHTFTLTDINDPTFGIMVKNVVFGEIAMNQFTFVVPGRIGGGEGEEGGGEGENEMERNDTLGSRIQA